MITSQNAFKKYGNPITQEAYFMTLWQVPAKYWKGNIPKKVYCNKDMVVPLSKAFENLIATGFYTELKTWDGCFNIRPQRTNPNIMSLHSWGVAVDVNAFENPQGSHPKLTKGFIKCFTDAGFDWGGDWKGTSVDGMHFQLKWL